MSLGLVRQLTQRARTFALAGLIVAGAVPFLAAGTSAASTAHAPAAGTIHVYIVNTGLSSTAPSNVFITGAFSDHGPGNTVFGT